VSKGKVITLKISGNLSGILNPRNGRTAPASDQFPQHQFKRHLRPQDAPTEGMKGVACFDAMSTATPPRDAPGRRHPAAIARRRIQTVSLRGLNVQLIFGSQRAMKRVEDFTEFEQLAAYFDGDPLTAMAKGINFLNRSRRSISWRKCKTLLDFPPPRTWAWTAAHPKIFW